MSTALLPFLVFAFAASATPGPNNIMAMSTAATHGLRAAVPVVGGVALGFGFMVLVVGTGLAGALASHPALHVAMRWAGAAWMLLLAWKIARSDAPSLAQPGAEAPIGFWSACALQWINPKAWTIALATAATYTVADDHLFGQVAVLAGLFTLVSVPSVGAWALLGRGAGSFLTSRRRMQAFNWMMGGLLAASVIPALAE